MKKKHLGLFLIFLISLGECFADTSFNLPLTANGVVDQIPSIGKLINAGFFGLNVGTIFAVLTGLFTAGVLVATQKLVPAIFAIAGTIIIGASIQFGSQLLTFVGSPIKFTIGS